MNTLESDVLTMLGLVRSLKNSFAPINRIPPEILSLIPDYYDEHDADQALVALTGVCRSWRDMLISRSSLWTTLDLMNVEKTRTYIRRSNSSPLKIYLYENEVQGVTYLNDAFSLAMRHIRRLKSLEIRGHNPRFDSRLFGRDLPSSRELSMLGTITWLPRNNMTNLRVFKLGSWNPIYGVTRLLDLLESSPLLHTVKLCGSIPHASNAPPQRTALLPHLNDLVVHADQAHSIVLNHLRIPMGASISQYFHFGGTKSPLVEYLPEASTNLMNLSHVNTVNLLFDSEEKFVELSGPSGSLRIFGYWKDWVTASWFVMDREILRSLSTPILSTVRKLSISRYGHPGPAEGYDCPIFQTLSSMTNLQTLELTECNNQPFILALDPEVNESKLVL